MLSNSSVFLYLNYLFLGKTVTSQDFDIGLMIYILLANYEINDYENLSDRSITAIFSRIINMRKEIARRFIRQLSKSKFKQYRDDISQVRSHVNIWKIYHLSLTVLEKRKSVVKKVKNNLIFFSTILKQS